MRRTDIPSDDPAPLPGGGSVPVSVLLVGLDDNGVQSLPTGVVPSGALLHFISSLSAVEPDILSDLRPQLVVTPLMGVGFDAHDLALRLTSLEFGGVLRVLAPPLPKPEMLRAELSHAAPGLTVDVQIMA